jgi:hypothetical protein
VVRIVFPLEHLPWRKYEVLLCLCGFDIASGTRLLGTDGFIMIDQIDQDLAAWTLEILGDITTRFDMPVDQPLGTGVVLYLLSFEPTPPASTGQIAPLQFTLRYLITTWAETPIEAHKLLGKLVLAAMEESRYEVELDPVPPEIWQAFRLPPKTAFVLRVLLRKLRQEPVRKPVTKVVVEQQPAISFYGLVRGPQNIPVVRARVELPFERRSTYTDSQGRFHFGNLPGGIPLSLRVKAKGHMANLTVEQPTTRENPYVVTLNLE